jgi:trk system potassium uptake protein TrkA
MKVVVTGGGAVGRHLAVDLTQRGHEVTLIEQDRALVEKLRGWAPSVNVKFGDACEPSVLEAASTASADVLVAATGDDEDNLVTSLLAKTEFAVPRVLARVNHPKNEWLFTEQWGVDAEVSPPHILTAMVEEAVTVGDLVRLIRLEGGRVSIVEMTLPQGSTSIGRAIYELRLPGDSVIVAVLREGHVVLPQPETVLAAGDEIVALANPEAERALRDAVVGEGMPGGVPPDPAGAGGATSID